MNLCNVYLEVHLLLIFDLADLINHFLLTTDPTRKVFLCFSVYRFYSKILLNKCKKRRTKETIIARFRTNSKFAILLFIFNIYR